MPGLIIDESPPPALLTAMPDGLYSLAALLRTGEPGEFKTIRHWGFPADSSAQYYLMGYQPVLNSAIYMGPWCIHHAV